MPKKSRQKTYQQRQGSDNPLLQHRGNCHGKWPIQTDPTAPVIAVLLIGKKKKRMGPDQGGQTAMISCSLEATN